MCIKCLVILGHLFTFMKDLCDWKNCPRDFSSPHFFGHIYSTGFLCGTVGWTVCREWKGLGQVGKLASQIPCGTCEQKAGKSSRNPHNDQSKEKLTIEEECNSSWAEKALLFYLPMTTRETSSSFIVLVAKLWTLPRKIFVFKCTGVMGHLA